MSLLGIKIENCICIMKKIFSILTIIVITVLLISCSTSKELRNYNNSINGKWQLKSIITEDIVGKVKVQLFNEADFNCFIASSWVFNNNNNRGTYTIFKNANECAGITRNIRWTIDETAGGVKVFQFKRLDENLKALDDGNGFRCTIIQLDNNTMQLRSTINFENKPAGIIYNFVKN